MKLFDWCYGSEKHRLSAKGFTASDVGTIARQNDTQTYFELVYVDDTGKATWIPKDITSLISVKINETELIPNNSIALEVGTHALVVTVAMPVTLQANLDNRLISIGE